MTDKIKGAVVRVHSDERRSTPIIINGHRVDVPHNEDFPLAGNYVEALENSRANFTRVRDLKAGEKPAGAEVGEETSAADQTNTFNQIPGGDALDYAPPQEEIITPAADRIDQEPGADNLTHATTGEERALAEDEAIKRAREDAQAARDGTAEPAVVLRNEEEDTRDSDVKDILDGSIAALTEQLQSIGEKAEIVRLLRNEKAGKSRAGAIAALEARRAELN